jgi:DNA-directed RNA polymerase subunit omega
MPEDNDVDWTTEVDSKYRLVLVAAKRSKQIQKGARPRLQSLSKKPTRVALEEVQHGLVQYHRVIKRQPGEE